MQQVGLGAFAHGVPEHLAEVAAVQPADRRDLLDGDVTLVVLLDEGEGFLDVKIPDPALAAAAPPRRALDQLVQEQKPVGDQVDGAGIAVVDDVHHFLFDHFAGVGVAGGVDGLGPADAGQMQAFVGPQAVELDPCVHPGGGGVGAVGGHLARHHQEPMPRGDGVHLLVGHQLAPALDDIMEQVMVAGIGPIGVGGGRALPPKLVKIQVDEALVSEHMEF